MSRRRKDGRTQKTREQARKIIVLGEGKSEKVYFESLGRKLGIGIRGMAMGKTGIDAFITKVRGSILVGEIDLLKGDRVVFVMDDDGRFKDHEVKKMQRKCDESGYPLYMSNPSFELWLYLHHKPCGRCSDQKRMEDDLRNLLGKYEKSEGIVFDLDMVNKAIVNAEKLPDQSERTPVGCHLHNPSTTIHVLVSELMNIR